ncbi:MAG: hypothetical protein WAN34_00465 [Acidimicrobiia bacterium]
MRHRVWPFAILVVALAVTSCGGGNGDASGDRSLDRCSLITPTEAEQWIGGAVAEPTPAEGIDGKPDPVTCEYRSDEARVHILVQVYDGEIYFAEPGSASRVGETIDDLGEDAFIGDGSVRFLQNGWTVSVDRISGQISDENLIGLARLISTKLP